MMLTYCSFADDDTCRGVVIFSGKLDPIQCSLRAHALGINPGGQLLAISFASEEVPMHVLADMVERIDKLTSVEDAVRLFDGVRLADLESDAN